MANDSFQFSGVQERTSGVLDEEMVGVADFGVGS
jgi:hypothetical protein